MKKIYMILSILAISLTFILIFYNSSEDKYSSCLYVPELTKSYIIVDSKDNIESIQKSLYSQNGYYHIKNDYLYKNKEKIKKLLNCSIDNMKFMNKKYNVNLLA